MKKKILSQMFVAYNCNGCSTAPLTQYKNNPIYQEITPEEDFLENNRDDRIYLDMRRSQGYTDKLEKLTTTKKWGLDLLVILRLTFGTYFQITGYIMTYKNYNISKEDTI